MNDRELLDELLRVATRLGVEVRIEPFETPPGRGGGRCRVGERQFIVLDARAPLGERVGALASALASLDLDDVYLAPEARDRVEEAREPRITARRERAARAPLDDGRWRAGTLVPRGSGRGDGRRGGRLGRAAAASAPRAWRWVEPGRGRHGGRWARPAGRAPRDQHAGERPGGRAHRGGGGTVGRGRPPRRGQGMGRSRVSERHPRPCRRDAHPKRRRLRAGGERHGRGRARTGPHHSDDRVARACRLRVRIPG